VPGLEIIETPGHASHHLAYSWHGNLFAGEAAGNYYAWNHSEYLRPATPPPFHRDLFLASLDKLAALPDQSIYYAHLGKAASSRDMLRRFRTQIWRWNDLAQSGQKGETRDKVARCVEILLESDPELRAFKAMVPDVQERERYFISNSVKGFIGFLDN
jgi:glyoxylase-like metal-dependent hydrolase (beta-lactamase superfamily II)